MAFLVGVGPASNSVVGGPGTIAVTLNGTTAGRHLIIGVAWYDPNEDQTDTINSITISGESNATLIDTPSYGIIGRTTQLAYLANNTGGGNKTVTVTGTANGATDYQIFVLEFSGGDVGAFLGAFNKATGGGNPASLSLTTATNGALIVAYIGAFVGADLTPGAGYTNIDVGNDDIGGFFEGEYDLDAGAAGAKTVNFSDPSAAWMMSAASFKAAIGVEGAASFPNMSASGGPSAAGAATFQQLAGQGMGLPFGHVSFQSMSASGGPGAVGVVSFAQMTAQSSIPAGVAAFEQLTAEGDARQGAIAAPTFMEMTATGTTVPVNVASGVASFEALLGKSFFNAEADVEFEAMIGAGRGRGPVLGAASFEPMIVISPAGRSHSSG